MRTVSRKAITDVERRYMGWSAAEYDELQAWLIEHGVSGAQAARMVRHLDLLGRNPRLAIDSCTGQTRWQWRQILEEHQPPIPPSRRREAGHVRPLLAGAVAVGAGGAATGHFGAAAVLACLLVITDPDGEELLEAA